MLDFAVVEGSNAIHASAGRWEVVQGTIDMPFCLSSRANAQAINGADHDVEHSGRERMWSIQSLHHKFRSLLNFAMGLLNGKLKLLHCTCPRAC